MFLTLNDKILEFFTVNTLYLYIRPFKFTYYFAMRVTDPVSERGRDFYYWSMDPTSLSRDWSDISGPPRDYPWYKRIKFEW